MICSIFGVRILSRIEYHNRARARARFHSSPLKTKPISNYNAENLSISGKSGGNQPSFDPLKVNRGEIDKMPKLAILAIVVFGVIVIATAVPPINQTITDWLRIIFHS